VDDAPPYRDALTAEWARRDRHANAADAVHSALQRLIVSGVLEPGTRLGEEDFARLFDVSRTPIREAFLRLEAEHLARRTSGRSLEVAGVTADEILEVYAVRVAVVGLAGRLAAESARPQDIEGLRWLNARLRDAIAAGADPMALSAINHEFHEAIAKAGRNAFLLEVMTSVHDRIRRFRGTTLADPARPGEVIAEHERLIDAIATRDPDRAEAVAKAHMVRAMEVRIQLLRAR
jgi:DNA-binding GntR family transcriptional regulator